jgi:hypothetical protein
LNEPAKEYSAIPKAKMHVRPGPESHLGIAQVPRIHFAGINGTAGGCEQNSALAPVCASFDDSCKRASPFQFVEYG